MRRSAELNHQGAQEQRKHEENKEMRKKQHARRHGGILPVRVAKRALSIPLAGCQRHTAFTRFRFALATISRPLASDRQLPIYFDFLRLGRNESDLVERDCNSWSRSTEPALGAARRWPLRRAIRFSSTPRGSSAKALREPSRALRGAIQPQKEYP